MQVRFLGTGTSQGVPIIGCKCDVCQSKNPKDKRLRSSIYIEWQGCKLVIDTGPDFRYQLLREGIDDIDAVIYTHEHKDHVAGLDDIRPINFLQKKSIEVYANNRVEKALRREFYYIFEAQSYPGVPKINLNHIENKAFFIGGKKIQPIEGLHFKLPVFGYRIDDFCYITDMNYISEEEKQKLKGLKVLVLNALQIESHISHFTLQEAIDLVEELKPEQAYFTHASHRLGKYDDIQASLPSNITLAYDGLRIDV